MKNTVSKELAGMSAIVYHATSFPAAFSILKNSELIGTFARASESESRITFGKGTYYYVSMTRTRASGYIRTYADKNVIFEIDGKKLGQKYKAAPVNYWLNNGVHSPNSDEQEDRVMLKENSIKNFKQYIKKVYIIWDRSERRANWSHGLANQLKKLGVPIIVYEKYTDFVVNNEKKSITFNALLKEIKLNKDSQHTIKPNIGNIKMLAAKLKKLEKYYEAIQLVLRTKKLTIKEAQKKVGITEWWHENAFRDGIVNMQIANDIQWLSKRKVREAQNAITSFSKFLHKNGMSDIKELYVKAYKEYSKALAVEGDVTVKHFITTGLSELRKIGTAKAIDDVLQVKIQPDIEKLEDALSAIFRLCSRQRVTKNYSDFPFIFSKVELLFTKTVPQEWDDALTIASAFYKINDKRYEYKVPEFYYLHDALKTATHIILLIRRNTPLKEGE